MALKSLLVDVCPPDSFFFDVDEMARRPSTSSDAVIEPLKGFSGNLVWSELHPQGSYGKFFINLEGS